MGIPHGRASDFSMHKEKDDERGMETSPTGHWTLAGRGPGRPPGKLKNISPFDILFDSY